MRTSSSANEFLIEAQPAGQLSTKETTMSTRISDEDIGHLLSFPVHAKVKLLRAATASKPMEIRESRGAKDYEKAVLRLRNEGFKLIDFEASETTLSTIWHRSATTMFGLSRFEVIASLNWEAEGWSGSDAGLTTFKTWKIA